MKHLIIPTVLLATLNILGGCTSPAIKAGDVVSIKERFFGLNVSQSPSDQTPQVKVGFSTTVIQFVPTSTNDLHSARYADTFTLKQGLNPFGFDVEETSGFGDVLIGTNGYTRAIVPAGVRLAATTNTNTLP